MEHPIADAETSPRPPHSPEVRAIEAELPRLAHTLRLALERLAVEIETRFEPEPAAPPQRSESLRVALASWIALRSGAAMAAVLPDLAQRERIVAELFALLDSGGDATLLDESVASETVRDATADPLRRDALRGRVDRASEFAVRHVLLGGPSPEESDLTPQPEETHHMARRAIALFLDYSLAITGSMLAGMAAVLLGRDVEGGFGTLLGYFVMACGGLANVYLIANTGTTLGKLSMDLEVLRITDGGRPELDTAFRREFPGRFLSNLLFGVGYLVAWGDPLRQTWGDRHAGTAVVRARTPRPWRLQARLLTAVSALIVVLYLPSLGKLRDLDLQAAEAMTSGESSVFQMTDSLCTLAERPVTTQAELDADLRAVVALAPVVKSRVRAVRQHTQSLLRYARVLTPWRTNSIARTDSLILLLEHCAISAEDFAYRSIAAQQAVPERGPGLRRGARYAASDMYADREYVVILATRLSARPSQ